jgi:ABC-2 type transport system permease protein
MVAMFVIELIFLAIGLLLGCAMKKYRRSGSAAVAIILVAYFLSVISSMQANLDFLKYITPLKYFDPARMLKDGRLDAGFLLLSAVIIVACTGTAYWVYGKRDLYI